MTEAEATVSDERDGPQVKNMVIQANKFEDRKAQTKGNVNDKYEEPYP